MATKVIRSSGNVFLDLGFGAQEAEHLRIRSDLLATLREVVHERKLTQARAATLFGVSQPRVSDLMRGKIDRFSIDTLVEMLARAGARVDLVVEPATASVQVQPLRSARPARSVTRPAASQRSGRRSRTAVGRRRHQEQS